MQRKPCLLDRVSKRTNLNEGQFLDKKKAKRKKKGYLLGIQWFPTLVMLCEYHSHSRQEGRQGNKPTQSIRAFICIKAHIAHLHRYTIASNHGSRATPITIPYHTYWHLYSPENKQYYYS